MLLDMFGGLAESSLCLLGPREVGSRYSCHTVVLRLVTSLPVVSPVLDVLPFCLCAPSLWSVLLDGLANHLRAPFLWSVLLDVLPNRLHAPLSL